ncbi:RNA recognition motif-containing protein [Prochlorococcus marinus]|uniref:RNA recognition motif-containing protein n=1 Tax=Prochlorococcus marinus TaxID=1219 RepID=UPI0022B4C6D8|nr:RNA recognition motif-containing protein [Prochlorococcus marinus]
MTTTHKQVEILSKSTNDAIIDQLRACNTKDEILAFERWFDKTVNAGPLYAVICQLLRNRSISRSTASKWFETLLQNRDERIEKG